MGVRDPTPIVKTNWIIWIHQHKIVKLHLHMTKRQRSRSTESMGWDIFFLHVKGMYIYISVLIHILFLFKKPELQACSSGRTSCRGFLEGATLAPLHSRGYFIRSRCEQEKSENIGGGLTSERFLRVFVLEKKMWWNAAICVRTEVISTVGDEEIPGYYVGVKSPQNMSENRIIYFEMIIL